MGLDDFTAGQLFDLFLDLNVTEEWQLLSIREHWKQQYKKICGLFATDKVELNKRLLRLNKAYNVFTSIEKGQRRQLYLRFRPLLLSDQIDLLEQINDSDQSSVDTDFLKNSRNLGNIADQKKRQYDITKERRLEELGKPAVREAVPEGLCRLSSEYIIQHPYIFEPAIFIIIKSIFRDIDRSSEWYLDLIDDVNERIIVASTYYDPSRGYPFSDYAVHWVLEYCSIMAWHEKHGDEEYPSQQSYQLVDGMRVYPHWDYDTDVLSIVLDGIYQQVMDLIG